MTVTPEFQEASARACIRALRGLESTAIMLEKWGPETFPAGDDGKIHFGRLMTDSTAEAIREAWRTAIREVEHFPENPESIVVQIGKLRHALGKIADLEDSEAGEPLDDAIAIAKAALAGQPEKARLLSEWHEDIGPVVWWRFCRDERPDEAAWIGTPLDDDWPGYHTHWTPHPPIPTNAPQT